ncbi:MAG: hypothetical protein HYY85_11095 [Deltaproteobacteria bacterium]|nr:hypothetical protein [Deltaproteobacteria bacterium]
MLTWEAMLELAAGLAVVVGLSLAARAARRSRRRRAMARDYAIRELLQAAETYVAASREASQPSLRRGYLADAMAMLARAREVDPRRAEVRERIEALRREAAAIEEPAGATEGGSRDHVRCDA